MLVHSVGLWRSPGKTGIDRQNHEATGFREPGKGNRHGRRGSSGWKVWRRLRMLERRAVFSDRRGPVMVPEAKVLVACLCCAFLLVGCAGQPLADSIPEHNEETQLEEQGVDVAPDAAQERTDARGTRLGPDKR